MNDIARIEVNAHSILISALCFNFQLYFQK